jgi:thioredoxin 1
MDKKKLLARILVPVLIVVALVAIWIVKTDPFSDTETETTKEPTTASSRTTKSTDDSATVTEETEPIEDFELEAASIDLDALKEYNLPIIIDFGADYCEPCRDMAPVLVTMNEQMQGKAIIKFVDIEKYSEIANDFPISVIPTQFFFNSDGTPYVPSDELVEDLDIVFDTYNYKDTGELAFTVHQGGLTEDELRAILVDMGVSQ